MPLSESALIRKRFFISLSILFDTRLVRLWKASGSSVRLNAAIKFRAGRRWPICRWLSLNRRVAVKVLPFAAALDLKQLHRFKNEAQTAALLHHPNIVPVYAVGCEAGVHYFAMQYIQGRSLAALIDEKTFANASGSETPRDARIAELGLRAARALEYPHEQGVVHRDIKPANLLLDERDELWITDFGLALFQTGPNVTISGELVGTLRYMSPEQALAKRGLIDHRTDIYSLGATLYELLTFQPVFAGQDGQALLYHKSPRRSRPCPVLSTALSPSIWRRSS